MIDVNGQLDLIGSEVKECTIYSFFFSSPRSFVLGVSMVCWVFKVRFIYGYSLFFVYKCIFENGLTSNVVISTFGFYLCWVYMLTTYLFILDQIGVLLYSK